MNCGTLTTVIGLNNDLYISAANNMFYNCNSLKIINLDKFQTGSNYIDISYMFYNCYNLESITFSTSENSFGVNNMNNMFYNCKSLKKIDFRSFNASTYSNNYIDMSYLCNNCEKLTEVKGLFNNLYITSAHNMFYNCISLKEINIETFDRSTSGYIDFSYMFYNCYNLETITFTYLKQAFRVKYMNNMFNNCTSLKEINLGNFYGTTSNIINMENLFFNCISLSKFFGIGTIYISSGIKMFYNCKSLKTIELQNLKTISDTFIDLSDMFYNCHNLISIYFPSSNGVIGVRKMTGMFFNCTLLKKVNLNSFSSSSNYYLDLSNLFSGCISLEEDLKISKAFYVYDIRGMFSDCISLKSINLGKFKTRENTFISLSKLFYNCKSLETISFSSDDPDFGVKDMDNMFYGCNALKEIDFSSWKGSSDHYINMSRLFYNSKSLTTVGGDFNNLYISDAREMFYGCVSLKSLSFGPNMVTDGINLKKMFYNCENIESIRFYCK
jgi:surface protein